VSQLRAIELGTPVVRCVNTGLSASIDGVGRVERVLEPQVAAAFVATPAVATGRPLAIVVGDAIALLALAIVVIGIVRRDWAGWTAAEHAALGAG
jgi:apolipoprotein N-acyltransferase